MEKIDDASAVSRFNESGAAPLLLICEHASAHIPAEFNNLGLENEALQSHVAYDIGALKLAKLLSSMLDAQLVATAVSRLVYDCNRPLGAPDATPAVSEIYEIPGNADLDDGEIRARYERFYRPFERAIQNSLNTFVSPPIFITIHSFTPVYHGSERALDVGVIVNGESRFADFMLQKLSSDTSFRSALNEPYGPEDGVTHTLDVHANSNGLLNTMVEVSNRLLRNDEDCENVARQLSTIIAGVARQCGYSLNVKRA